MTDMPLVQFNVTDAAIATLAEKYKNPTVPTSPGEYEQLKGDIKVVRDLRVEVDTSRKQQNGAALAHQRAVNKEGHRIIDALKAIEAPMKLCKAEVDDAEELKVKEAEEFERARIFGIEDRVGYIVNLGVIPFGIDMQGLINRVSEIDGIDPGDGSWDEFAKRAADAKQNSLNLLRLARDDLKAKEAEQKTLDAARKVLEAEKKIQDAEKAALAAERKKLDDEKRERAAKDEEVRNAELEELKKKELEELHRRAELEARERAKLVAPDKDKLLAVASQLQQIVFHQCGDPAAQGLMDRYQGDIEKLALAIEMEAAQL